MGGLWSRGSGRRQPGVYVDAVSEPRSSIVEGLGFRVRSLMVEGLPLEPTPIMENLMHKKLFHEMETGLYRVYIYIYIYYNNELVQQALPILLAKV